MAERAGDGVKPGFYLSAGRVEETGAFGTAAEPGRRNGISGDEHAAEEPGVLRPLFAERGGSARREAEQGSDQHAGAGRRDGCDVCPSVAGIGYPVLLRFAIFRWRRTSVSEVECRLRTSTVARSESCVCGGTADHKPG